MKRGQWGFDYTASKLLEAAVKKREAHLGKKAWWEKKKAEVMEQVRETGITVHESVAATYSSTKGHYGPEIEIDAGLQRDLTECQRKIMEHDKLVSEYGCWIQVLGANPESRLTLDNDDWLYFFGE